MACVVPDQRRSALLRNTQCPEQVSIMRNEAHNKAAGGRGMDVTVETKRTRFGVMGWITVDGIPAFLGAMPHPMLLELAEAEEIAEEVKAGVYALDPKTVKGKDCTYLRYES